MPVFASTPNAYPASGAAAAWQREMAGFLVSPTQKTP
jgi:hypothetical protein